MIVVSGQALITLDRHLDLTKVCLGSSYSDVLGALRIKPADGGCVHKIIRDLEMPSLLPILHGAGVLSPLGAAAHASTRTQMQMPQRLRDNGQSPTVSNESAHAPTPAPTPFGNIKDQFLAREGLKTACASLGGLAEQKRRPLHNPRARDAASAVVNRGGSSASENVPTASPFSRIGAGPGEE